MRPIFRYLIPVSIFFSLIQSQTRPVTNLHENPPQVWALTHGIIHTEPGKIIKDGSIVIRDGSIEAVGKSLTIPRDATVVDLKGATVYPGFIDSWLEVTADSTLDGTRKHWNTKVHSERIAFNAFRPKEKELTALQSLGFTAANLVLDDGIFRGQSSLTLINKDPEIQNVSVGQVMDFSYGGWRSRDYPNSLLGCIALIRQTLLDASWYGKARVKASKFPQVNEPIEEDIALDVLDQALKAGKPFMFSTSDEIASLRAGAIAREFNLNLWLKGNGYEYRRLDEIAKLDPFIILPLNIPGKPDISNPYQALQYTTEDLKHWDMVPDNVTKLIDRGLKVALTSSGLKDKTQFRKRLEQSVQRGLPEKAALAALTTTPARKLGMGNSLGKISPGFMANLVIVDGNYFDSDSKVQSIWIAGEEIEVHPRPRVDFTGEWDLIMNGDSLLVEVTKKREKYSGTLKIDTLSLKMDGLVIDDDRLNWTVSQDTSGVIGVTRYSGHLGENQAEGFGIRPDGSSFQWLANRKETKDSEPAADTLKTETSSDLTVTYPEGAFGFETPPEKPYAILVDNATIWTSGPKGKLEDWDILFVDGKIKKIAVDISIPRGGARVIDGKGKHVTPGLIDAHSHSAASSINEGTQSVTSEVRIQDVINSDDIAIYRELAGGLTMANVLHGSANTIGGQNAVLKLRWGQPAKGLIYKKAPPGIKFALGENVKQSNWGDSFNVRYPQTRMGVEQVLRDAFEAARDYQREWSTYNRDSRSQKKKAPPRRNLELEALVEVLEGKRLVHCHSYRQDEILMLTRVAEDFGFTIGTFQHVLEGYKVAERIADHGAGASTFSDWWAYKYEVIDAIPFNGTLMANVGVNVSFNSDSGELARRMNTEAAKAVKYGGLSEEEALKLVTINPAKQLGIDSWVGSLEVGKDADFVIWSDHPLSTYTVCEQTWIDGIQYFSIEMDQTLQERDQKLRNRLVQKILQADDNGENFMKPGNRSHGQDYSCSEEGGVR